MTDITNQDRRTAIDVAEAIERGDYPMANMWPILARVILATVDAPAPTLAEELRSWAEDASYDEDRDNLLHAAARAEQMEHGIAEARAEVERLKRDLAEAYKTRDARDDEVDSLRAEVERLTAERDRLEAAQYLSDGSAWGGPVREPTVQKGAESNAETPDPADVKPGEAWIVEVRGERRAAVKDRDDYEPWNTFNADGWYLCEDNGDVNLIARLVPAPRVITNPDELEKLAVGSIIRAKDGDACRKSDCGDWSVDGLDGAVGYGPRQVLPATVLWEPGA